MSLASRCKVIIEKFGIGIQPSTLRLYYLQNRITWKKLKYNIATSKSDDEILTLRLKFLEQLHRKLETSPLCIYIDESSMNRWDQRQRIWQPKGDSVRIKIPATRGASITVICAITNDGRMFTDLVETTNQVTVTNFLRKLGQQLDLRSSSIFLDNHKSHHSLYFQAVASEFQACPEYLP
jgi:hypothetical protein